MASNYDNIVDVIPIHKHGVNPGGYNEFRT